MLRNHALRVAANKAKLASNWPQQVSSARTRSYFVFFSFFFFSSSFFFSFSSALALARASSLFLRTGRLVDGQLEPAAKSIELRR